MSLTEDQKQQVREMIASMPQNQIVSAMAQIDILSDDQVVALLVIFASNQAIQTQIQSFLSQIATLKANIQPIVIPK